MKINGRKIAAKITLGLKNKISRLTFSPHLSVILIGSDLSSQKYVAQKIKVGGEIGIKISPLKFNSLSIDHLKRLVESLNNDPLVNGIIIQRPVPLEIQFLELNNLVLPKKDVDGFHPQSDFDPPVALAVIEILKSVRKQNLLIWLKRKNILVIGRGETAGKPIAKYFNKIGLKFSQAHSQTNNLRNLCLKSDIIISCVGKPNIVRQDMLRPDSILIGVGLHPEDLKLKSDYDQEKIKDKVKFYTPVPGGVGPVNVAMLMKNVVKAASWRETSGGFLEAGDW